MKLFQSLIVSGVFTSRILAVESTEVTAVIAGFSAPTGEEQFKARTELDRLVDQATIPGKGDSAAVTRVLLETIQQPDTGVEAKKYLLRSLARVGTADAVEPLGSLLFDQEMIIREEARLALVSIQDPSAAGILEAGLSKVSARRDKLGLIAALGASMSETTVAALAPLVVDPDPEIAAAAINALAGFGGGKAAEALVQALASARVVLSLKPALEMGIVVAGASDPEALTAIYQTTASDPVKTAAFIALMKSSHASSKAELVCGAMESQSSPLRREAVAAGIQSDEPAVQAAILESAEFLARGDRLVLLANSHLLKPVAVAEKTALDALASEDEEDRIIALGALGRIGTKSAFEAVLKSLGVRGPRVNQAAANALAAMNYPDAETKLLALLKDPPGPEKILAIKAVTSRNLDGASRILIQILKESDAAASREAMRSLYFIATPEDFKILCAEAVAATDEATKRTLSSLCKRIANRIGTPEVLESVEALD